MGPPSWRSNFTSCVLSFVHAPLFARSSPQELSAGPRRANVIRTYAIVVLCYILSMNYSSKHYFSRQIEFPIKHFHIGRPSWTTLSSRPVARPDRTSCRALVCLLEVIARLTQQVNRQARQLFSAGGRFVQLNLMLKLLIPAMSLGRSLYLAFISLLY